MNWTNNVLQTTTRIVASTFQTRQSNENVTTPGESQALHDRQGVVERHLIEVLKGYNLTAFQYFSKLAGISTFTPPTTTTRRIPFTTGVVSWGFITPITLIGFFLLVVAGCLLYHNWRDKRRLQRYSPPRPDPPEFNRQVVGDMTKRDRCSTRSTSSSRSMGATTSEQIVPMPIRKATLRLNSEEDWKLSNSPRVLSPIEEVNSSHSKNTITEIKPKFFNSKERFADYHLTWVSQSSKEAEMRNDGHMHVIENPLTEQVAIGNDQLYQDTKREVFEKKSPYHYPHHNTPTTGFDRESNGSGNLRGGDSAVSTHDDVSLPSTIYPVAGQEPTCLTSGADLSSIHTYPEPRSARPEDYNIPSNQQSTVTSFTDSVSGTLSLPSSISRFHASRLNNTPNYLYPLASTQNGSPVRLNFTVASSIDLSENNSQYSDNTSMFPNVGSSITSFGPSIPPSLATSSCPSDNISPDYVGSGGRQTTSQQGTEASSLHNSLSTNSGDVNVPPTAENSQVSPAREAELFRSWSLTMDVNSGSLGNLPALAPTPLPSGESYSVGQNKDDSSQSRSDGHITLNSYDFNHNLSPGSSRKVKFSVPILNKKQYWV